MKDDPTPGTRYYRFTIHPNKGARLGTVWLVRRSGTWWRWRNIDTGDEWNENGNHYHRNIVMAFDAFAMLHVWEMNEDWRLIGIERLQALVDAWHITDKRVAAIRHKLNEEGNR